jgi:hypothetical protein
VLKLANSIAILYSARGAGMSSPVKITRDLRVIAPPDAPPLTGAQALELGKRLLARGCIAVALEAVDRGSRLPRSTAGYR